MSDDIMFHREFESEFVKVSNNIPNDWKLLYLGAYQYQWENGIHLRYPEEDSSEKCFYSPVKTFGTFALGIQSSIYDIILRQNITIDPPSDPGPAILIHNRFPDDCYVLHPNLIIENPKGSTVKSTSGFGWEMEKYDYPFKRDLISVVMPVYNSDSMIENAIHSMQIQTYRDLEIIIVDDASTDNTARVVERLMKEDNRIRLLRNAENRGVGYSRSQGIRDSKGVIIVNQDADDISLSDRIEKQVIPIYEKSVEFTLALRRRSHCTMDELDLSNQTAMFRLVESRSLKDTNGKPLYDEAPWMGIMSAVIRREIFEDLGLYWECRYAEDIELLERILYNKGGIHFQDEAEVSAQYLNKTRSVPEIYQLIDEVLVVSSEVGQNNLTSIYKPFDPEIDAFRKQYRERFLSADEYEYSRLDETEMLNEKISRIKHNSYLLGEDIISLAKSGRSLLTGDQNPYRFEMEKLEGECHNYRNTINQMKGSYSWKITWPLRIFGGFFNKE